MRLIWSYTNRMLHTHIQDPVFRKTRLVLRYSWVSRKQIYIGRIYINCDIHFENDITLTRWMYPYRAKGAVCQLTSRTVNRTVYTRINIPAGVAKCQKMFFCFFFFSKYRWKWQLSLTFMFSLSLKNSRFFFLQIRRGSGRLLEGGLNTGSYGISAVWHKSYTVRW